MLRSKGGEQAVVDQLRTLPPGEGPVMVEVVARLACTTQDLPFDGNVLLFMVGPQHRGVRFLTDILDVRTARAGSPTLRHLHEEYMGMPDYTCRFLASPHLFKAVDARVRAKGAVVAHFHWEHFERQEDQRGLQVLTACTGDARFSQLCSCLQEWLEGKLLAHCLAKSPVNVAARAADADGSASAEVNSSTNHAAPPVVPEPSKTPVPVPQPKPGDVVYVAGRNRKVYKNGTVIIKGKAVPVDEALAMDNSCAALEPPV